MLTIAEFKRRYIDKTGEVHAVLLNKDGECLTLDNVQRVTNSNGRLKIRWRALEVPDQWKKYTHVALLANGEVKCLQEITPITFEGRPRNVEISFDE